MPKQRESLYRIRCGACLNACPIYKNIGGHSYGTTYSGPIRLVITPHLKGIRRSGNTSAMLLPWCGNRTEVCSVKINLHELLLDNRYEAVESGYATWQEKLAWRVLAKGQP